MPKVMTSLFFVLLIVDFWIISCKSFHKRLNKSVLVEIFREVVQNHPFVENKRVSRLSLHKNSQLFHLFWEKWLAINFFAARMEPQTKGNIRKCNGKWIQRLVEFWATIIITKENYTFSEGKSARFLL